MRFLCSSLIAQLSTIMDEKRWLLPPSNHSSTIGLSHLISQVNCISLDLLTWNGNSNVKIADVWQSIRFSAPFKGGTSWFGIVCKSKSFDLLMVGV